MPLAEMFVLIGFYLIYAIEEVTHLLIDRCASSHVHSHGHGGGETVQMLDKNGNIQNVQGIAGHLIFKAKRENIHYIDTLY